MMTADGERYCDAMRETFRAVYAAYEEVEATVPRTRYPLARRLWWRVFGVPDDVRRARLRENIARAHRYQAALHAHRLEGCT